MRKFTAIVFALVMCLSVMVAIAVGVSAADTLHEGEGHHWTAWTTVNDIPCYKYRECSCGEGIEYGEFHDVEHVAAVKPGCDNEGNVEYWYCKTCGAAWLDESCEAWSMTNLKNVILPIVHENVIYVEAVAPDCHYTGNIEHWYCADCDMVWADEAQMQITNHLAVILPEVGGDVIHVEAKAPACFEEGNIEYWYCEKCEQVWQDEARTQLTNFKNVILPATHNNIVHIDAVAPDCHYTGNIEHWYCADCDMVWADEAQMQITNHLAVILPEVGGDVIHVEAKAPACFEEGNIEYWYCEKCEQVWQDEARTQLTNFKNVILPATHNNIVHIDAVAPGCHYTGNIEHWYCADCDMVWADETQMQITNHLAVILPALGGEVVHVEAKAPNCYEEGNIEYWYCAECEQVWQDEALTQLTNFKNVILPVNHATLTHFEAVAPGCHYEGNIEYWVCYTCETVWTDELLREISNSKNVILPELGGEVVHVEAKAPACFEDGNIEYWYCEECEKVWQDEARTQLTNFKNVILPMAHGEIIHVEAKAPACFEDGNIEYWYCVDCGYAWLDAECTRNTNLKAVILPMAHAEATHVEAKAPACFENGNIEYWYCAVCGQAWLDAECTLNTNLLAVVLPMAHGEIIHVEAKAPSCTDIGNIEYWYCAVCGQAWLDAECTLNTNMLAVVLPVAHELVHVEAKAPTCFEEGNVEYWYCEKCGYAWLDELCHLNTNLKSVILPITHEIKHVEAKAPTCFEEGNIEYWYCEKCGFAWLDELCQQNTNLKSVILPVSHNVEHVAAVAPTATENGNIEYWYCKDCGYAWLDELCTKNTNLKAVILPATGEPTQPENPGTGDNAVFFVVAIVAVATLGVAAVSFKKREN